MVNLTDRRKTFIKLTFVFAVLLISVSSHGRVLPKLAYGPNIPEKCKKILDVVKYADCVDEHYGLLFPKSASPEHCRKLAKTEIVACVDNHYAAFQPDRNVEAPREKQIIQQAEVRSSGAR